MVRPIAVLPSASGAAWLFVRFVVPLIAATVAVGLTLWLLLVAPYSTIQAGLLIAIPCAVVRLRRAEYRGPDD